MKKVLRSLRKQVFYSNKINSALKEIRKAKSIYNKTDNLTTLNYALREEKKILTQLKNYKSASLVSDSIYATTVLIYNNRFADKVSEMDAIYKTVENEKKIRLQKEKLSLQELKISNRNIYAILITSTLLILGIISFFTYKKNQFKRKQLRKEIDLKDALAKIKTQNRLQEQRLRISRDLHDNIGSQLTFIISSLDNLKYISKDINEKTKNKISHISQFTSQTIHQLRDTIWAMNKSEISNEDLQTRILSFVEKAKIATNNKIIFKVLNDDSLIQFTSIQGINIFRIVQEAINNSLKYADATEIIISTKKEKNKITISISDNGNGFDLKTIELGNGLSNMEKRMSEIDGKVTIKSELKKGTTITISLKI